MSNDNETGIVASIGIDVGDKYSHVCVLDNDGEVVEESRVKSTKQGISRYFSRFDGVRVALEVGTHSSWMSRIIKESGAEVIVANPRQVSLISRSDSKDDRADAELLGRLARVDPKLLSPVEHQEERIQIDREVLASRDLLVRQRTALINRVRGVVKTHGERVSKCAASCFHRRALEEIPKKLNRPLVPLISQIASLTKAIKKFDVQIERLANRYSQTEILRQVKGVGAITALAFVLVIGDATRFKSSRAVGSYLGLRPKRSESSDSKPELRITKSGNGSLRRLLIQCAQHILGRFGQDSDLRRWGLKLASRGAKVAKKKAVVAVARKLAVLLHRLMVTGEVYEPLRNAHRQTESNN